MLRLVLLDQQHQLLLGVCQLLVNIAAAAAE
jgi:hypothetical protein